MYTDYTLVYSEMMTMIDKPNEFISDQYLQVDLILCIIICAASSGATGETASYIEERSIIIIILLNSVILSLSTVPNTLTFINNSCHSTPKSGPTAQTTNCYLLWNSGTVCGRYCGISWWEKVNTAGQKDTQGNAPFNCVI